MPLLRLWLLAFVGFGLTIGAWSLAVPYNGNPDEISHALHAYQVTSGDIAPELAPRVGAYQWGPISLASPNCSERQPGESLVACEADLHGSKALVRIRNGVGRYNPFYYAVVGIPIKVWPSLRGVILARLISAAMSAALLAAALVSIVRYSPQRLMLGGLLFAASPMALNMSGAINPNGIEIAAGIAFFASAIPLLIGPVLERPPTWLVCVTVISAVILVTVRSAGPAWLALAAFALLLPLRLRTFKRVLRPVALRWGVLVVMAATIASVLWILIMKSSAIGGAPANLRPSQIVVAEFGRWSLLIDEMVGVLGWLGIGMWQPAYLFWEYPAGALLLVALAVGAGLDRGRLLIVAGGTVAIAAISEMTGANRVGVPINQGRYLLPTLSGALLLAAWIIEQRGAVTAARARLITRFAVVVTLPIQLHALQVTMAYYQRSIPTVPQLAYLGDFNPFTGDAWHPAVGSLVPFASATIGVVVLGVLCWRLSAGRDEPGAAAVTVGDGHLRPQGEPA